MDKIKEAIAKFINEHKWLLGMFIAFFIIGAAGLILAGFTKEALAGAIVGVITLLTAVFGLGAIILAFFKK